MDEVSWYQGNEELLRHDLEKAPLQMQDWSAVYAQRLGSSKRLLERSMDDHDSASFLSSAFPAAAGVALDNSGEFAVEGGEAGCSVSPDPNPASRLKNS
jgi:hypothetical protein